MNWDKIQGNWEQAKGSMRQQWAKLTDDDIEYAKGGYEKLVGKIQEQYGIAKDEAEKQANAWSDSNFK